MSLRIIILIFLLINSINSKAQNESLGYKNRICVGMGSENGYLGIDYSRDIYKSKIFFGIGNGIGTGLTGYIRYEPLSWNGVRPFLSAGISHSFGGTLILSPGTSVFSISAGLNYLPELKWLILPIIGLGASYYQNIAGEPKKGVNGFSPLIKIGIAISRKK